MNSFPSEVDFRFLGALQVYADGFPTESPRPQLVALLALLLTADSDGVSHDVCKNWVFDSIHVHNDRLNELVYELGKWLKPLGLDGRLSTNRRTGKRRLDVPKDRVDVHRFTELIREADAARHGTPSQAVAAYRAALDLYRDDPLPEFQGTDVDTWRTGLQRKYRKARISLAETELKLGNGEQVIDDLTDLHGRDPLDLQCASLYMYALAAIGDRPAALAVYQETIAALNKAKMPIDEHLVDLHEKIRNGKVPPGPPPIFEELDQEPKNASATKDSGVIQTGMKLAINEGSIASENRINTSAVNLTPILPVPNVTGPKIALDGEAYENIVDIRPE